MPSVFLFYLLCAITDCPPPTLHQRPFRSNLNNFHHAARPLIPGSSERRFVRSHMKSNIKPPIIATSLGDIQGRFRLSRKGRKIASFEGIPYALPPVGNLRFRSPVPVPPWADTLIANKTKKDCLQLDFTRLLQVRGSEDCLHVNVYVPAEYVNTVGQSPKNHTKLNKLPVLVYIHGGGWMSHSGTVYGPRYLLERNVILVTMNYRLGILGFLSTGDQASRGNFGLKDQTLALKWVLDHIADFGGDPKQMTLMGESTGAGSVALHMLSPFSAKLVSFQGAILLSGSSLNHWAIMNDTLSNTKTIAKRMHCPTEKSHELVECLRRKDPFMVVGQQLHLSKIPTISRLLFGPVIESKVNNPQAFLVEAPEVTYSRPEYVRPIPVITGFNKDEGGLFAANVYLVPFLFNAINNDFGKMAGYAMAYDKLKGVDVNATSDKISNFYFNNKRWSFNNRMKISEALGDRTINTGVYKFLQLHSQIAPTYGYFFTYQSDTSFLEHIGLRGKEWGVTHGDELPYIFSMDHVYDDFTNTRDLAMSEFMVDVCVNFATDRQPFPQNRVSKDVTWSPILNPKYMELLEVNTKRRIVPFPYVERMKFWESLHLN